MSHLENVIPLNRKRVAALVRLLSSNQDGEVLNCVNALKKVCNLNELGNEIESGKNNGISKEDMEYLYNTGHQDGYDKGYSKGKKDGLEEGKKFGRDKLICQVCGFHENKMTSFADSEEHK
jgi:flagellar biosynthesis/type III secretory pathway protein FliH